MFMIVVNVINKLLPANDKADSLDNILSVIATEWLCRFPSNDF